MNTYLDGELFGYGKRVYTSIIEIAFEKPPFTPMKTHDQCVLEELYTFYAHLSPDNEHTHS